MEPGVLLGAAIALTIAAAIWWFVRGRAPAAPPTPTKSERVRKADRHAVRTLEDHDWSDDDITVLRVSVDTDGSPEPANATTELFFADPDAEVDIPTHGSLTMVTSAVAQSDAGRRRRRNEDRYLQLDEHRVYAVADGMGGHAGGAVAAQLAIDTLRDAFVDGCFDATVTGDDLPRRAEELVKAVQRANLAVYRRGRDEAWLASMGTTLVAARFAPRKERLYVAHVGDSRCYRLRDGALTQLTRDHTYAELGLIDDGPAGSALSRAVGSSQRLTIDVIIATPEIGDRYLLCSDGLSRMIETDEIAETLEDVEDIEDSASTLVQLANEGGGADNITVVVIDVCRPTDVIQKEARRRTGS